MDGSWSATQVMMSGGQKHRFPLADHRDGVALRLVVRTGNADCLLNRQCTDFSQGVSE
jgi:hypothetical protein